MKKELTILTILMITILFSSCGGADGTLIDKTAQKINAPTTDNQAKARKDLLFKLNETIQIGHYVITVTKFIDNVSAPDEFSTPDKGKKFTAIEVLYENRTNNKQLNYNPFEWKLIDSDGYNYEMDMNSVKEPNLHDGTLNPGQKARGWITFQSSKNSKNFKVQFQPSWVSNENVEVQLY